MDVLHALWMAVAGVFALWSFVLRVRLEIAQADRELLEAELRWYRTAPGPKHPCE